MKKRLLVFAILSLIVFLGLFFYVWYQFHTSIALHVLGNKQTPFEFNLTASSHQITSADNIKLALWYIPAENAKAVLILVHGYATNGGGKAEALSRAQSLNQEGYSTVLIDLRSFGESEGNKIYLGTKEWQDVTAAYDFAKALPENKDKKVGIWGVSMGAATAIVTAGKTGKGDFVIAEAPFSDYQSLWVEQIKRKGYPKILTPILLPLLDLSAKLSLGLNYQSYSPNNLIGNIHVPIFIISAEDDNWVGSLAGKRLFDLANFPKEFWHANTTHEVFNDNPNQLKTKVLEFLQTI